ncbi:hypothetical protein QJ856_gp0383 [Tupanvirus deep ocean]|uniref:Uncharacterized protein n=2 Tax=Tupanvirus TaxID=2094720 RepID=A0AC62A9B7_9VIRU|nr:hypothetical protein QJ856_gp0383 [Tupanvirus deep ocean]QKU34355.1 hypothetical protein [Tupanvirus deep ocean]
MCIFWCIKKNHHIIPYDIMYIYINTMQNSNAIAISPIVLIGGALTFVGGLAWNDAFKTLIDSYYPDKSKNTVFAKFLYAIVVTIVIIIISFSIYMVNNKFTKFKK